MVHQASVHPTTSNDSGSELLPMEVIEVNTESQGDIENNPLIKYFSETFKKRLCNRFVVNDKNKKNTATSKDNQYCCCGFKKEDHELEASRELSLGSLERLAWNSERDTTPMETDAFGEMEFSSQTQKLCKYVRVKNDTDVNQLMQMMLDKWNMEKPNLLISVTGGAKNFRLKPRLKEVFRHGLIKAADSTGAWIVTGGTNAGVMKHVGEAIRESAIARGASKTPLVAIGIATWGCINNREILVNKNGCWPAIYKSKETEESTESPLDPNHTHFILVDNGTQNKFGAEIQLRAKLESKISTMKALGGEHAVTVPVVCIVLEGGPNTMETVKSAIENGTPVIVVKGSGRAADILAYAYAMSREEDVEVVDKLGKKHKRVAAIFDEKRLWSEVRDQIMATYSLTDMNDGEKYVEFVKACIMKRDHMTVFSLDENGSAKDIDVTILKALLKVNRDKGLDQLKLALAWNRIDVAREEIFTDDVTFHPHDLDELMYTAIINNRVDFVKLLLEKGVSLRDFLTVKRLLRLYNEPKAREWCPILFKHVKRRSYISLRQVGDVMKELINDFFEPIYCRDPYRRLNAEDVLDSKETVKKGIANWIQQTHDIHVQPITKKRITTAADNSDFDDPAKELFTFCALMHMKELAVIFWHEGKDDIALALNAQLLLQNIMDKEKDSDIGQILEEHVIFYKELAISVLRECYASDPRKTTLLLVRELPNFDNTTVLKIAVEAENMEFVSHPACQNLLTTIWMGHLMDDNSSFRTMICMFIPFLAPVLLTFRYQDQLTTIINDTHAKSKRNTASPVEYAGAGPSPKKKKVPTATLR